MPRRPRTTAPVLALLAACGLAHAGEPVIEVIYTKVPTLPSSLVPGALDLSGQPAETRFRALEDLILSPDGTRWFLKGRTQQGADLENITFMGTGASGTMFVQEGQPMPGSTDPNELVEFFGSGLGRFDEANRFAFSARARGGVASVFQKVILWDGANFTIPFQMGSPLTGLVDDPSNPSGDELYGNSVGSIHLLNTGRIGAQDSTIQNIHSSRRPAIFYDTAAFKQSGVSSVAGLDGITVETMAFFDANKFYTTPDGTNYIAQGRVVGPSTADAVLITEDRVVIQEGSPIAPGSSVIVASIVETHLAASGDWYSRGTSAAPGVWAVKNGEPVAVTGGSVLPDSTEHWAGSFLAFTGNSEGDWLLIGTTDNPDPARDTIAVLNGERIVAREGDQIDLNGDGILDDDAFIGRGNNTLSAFEPNDAALSDDLMLYFIANLRDAAGNDLNSDPAFGAPQAFLRVDLGGGACPADWNGDGVVNSSDISAFLTSWLDSLTQGNLTADFNGDMTVNSSDISAFLSAWLAALGGC